MSSFNSSNFYKMAQREFRNLSGDSDSTSNSSIIQSSSLSEEWCSASSSSENAFSASTVTSSPVRKHLHQFHNNLNFNTIEKNLVPENVTYYASSSRCRSIAALNTLTHTTALAHKTSFTHSQPFVTQILREELRGLGSYKSITLNQCLHEDKETFCITCTILICRGCLKNHSTHRFILTNQMKLTIGPFYEDMSNQVIVLLEYLESIFSKSSSIIDNLDTNMLGILTEVYNSLEIIYKSIQRRENSLKADVKKVYESKVESLKKQFTILEHIKRQINIIKNIVESKTDLTDPMELITLHFTIKNNLNKMDIKNLELNPQEDAIMSYNPNIKDLCQNIEIFGHVLTNGKALNTKAYGIGTEIATLNLPNCFSVQCFNHFGEKVKTGGDLIKATLENPSGRIVEVPIHDYSNGEYTGIYIPNELGKYALRISLRSLPILNSFNSPICIPKRSISNIQYPPIDTFGQSSNREESLSKGWGIHCDIDGTIYVTDCSLHCILVYDYKLNFQKRIGYYGQKDGEFNRPAGITVDNQRRIIVVDKDNHRVQVFSCNGNFIMKFGRRGTRVGEFCYPWDVDTNHVGHIVVSDSKNNRVQLFDKNGIFLAVSDIKNYGNAIMPTSLYFDCRERIVFLDFYKGFLNILTYDKRRSLSLLNVADSEHLDTLKNKCYKPQSIFINLEGYIFISDPQKSRILIFLPNWNHIRTIEYRRVNHCFYPCSMTMSPDGYLYVLDNNFRCIYKM